jgi:Zn-dependent protease/CBS domain-containing protein
LLVPLFVLAGAAPEGPGVPIALAWLVMMFACVVVHELAHCFVGRAHGAVVHEIILLPIGGVSKVERLPERPRDELAMSIAGPAASLGLALLAGMVTVLAGESLLPVEILGDSLLRSLFWFNLLVAGFNLLPAFPLDGGRVLRALLEQSHDLQRATHVAATAGRAVAIVMIVGGLFFDVWLTIIGVFVYFGASAEEASTIIHLRLTGHRVVDTMVCEPATVEPAASVVELRALLRRNTQRAFPVVGAAGYEGMLDARAIELSAADLTAADLAERDAPLVAPTDPVEDRLPELLGTRVRALAVVRDGGVVGVLRLEDVQHLVNDEARSDGRSAPV